jgi:integrase
VAIYTGGRESEVDHLAWDHLDWTNETIRIYGTKTDGAYQVIPFHPVLHATLSKERKSNGPIVSE